MRKLIPAAALLLLSIVLLTMASFAWASTARTGVYRTQSFNAASPDASYIYIGQSSGSRGSQTYVGVDAGKTIKPVTTTDYSTWKWENGTTLTSGERSENVISESVYFNSDAQFSYIRIAEVAVTGAGSLAPAIRVAAVAVGVGDIATGSVDGCDGRLNIVTRNAYRPVNIYVWIEGTDPACTYENIASAGAIVVNITFEGVT